MVTTGTAPTCSPCFGCVLVQVNHDLCKPGDQLTVGIAAQGERAGVGFAGSGYGPDDVIVAILVGRRIDADDDQSVSTLLTTTMMFVVVVVAGRLVAHVVCDPSCCHC